MYGSFGITINVRYDIYHLNDFYHICKSQCDITNSQKLDNQVTCKNKKSE